jgi:ABC-type long-subunit fatty acid transport system fused permease/ATPase subunit
VIPALLIGLVWLLVATVLALVVGRGLRTADLADRRGDAALRAEFDAVLAGLEADLRAAAATRGPAA